MDSSGIFPFLELPAELRIEVYHHLLIREIVFPCLILQEEGADGWRTLAKRKRDEYEREDGATPPSYVGHIYPQILQTCRQIHTEGLPILYGENVFQRHHGWPKEVSALTRELQPVPVRETQPLTLRSMSMITRVKLTNADVSDWSGDDGELHVFNEFPQMKELHIDISGCPPPGDDEDDDLSSYWGRMIGSVSRNFGRLRSFKFSIRIDLYDRDYPVYDEPYPHMIRQQAPNPKWDISYFRGEKERIEDWLSEYDLFTGRHIAWTFYFSPFSWEEAPHQIIMMEITNKPADENNEPPILCQIRTDDGRVFNKGTVLAPPECDTIPEMVQFTVQLQPGSGETLDLVEF